MLEEAVRLLAVLCQQGSLTETEFTLKEAVSGYVELHLRAATAMLSEQMKDEGLLDGDLTKPTPAEH